MTPQYLRTSLCHVTLLCGTALAAFLPQASASSIQWTGSTSTDYSVASNWSPATVPTITDLFRLNGTAASALHQPALTVSSTVSEVQFFTSGWTISGGSGIQLGITGAGSTFIEAGTPTSGADTINADIFLASGTGYWIVNSSGTMVVNGALSATSGVEVKYSNAASNSGLTILNATSKGFTGASFLTNFGSLRAGADDVLGSGTLIWGSNTSGTLSTTGSHSLSSSIVFAGTTLSISGTLTNSGTVSLSSSFIAAGQRVINVTGVANFSGGVTNGTGASGFTLNSAVGATGTLILSGVNTFTGSTVVSAGELLIQGGSLSTSSNVTVAASGTIGTGKAAGASSFGTLNTSSMLLTGSSTSSTLLFSMGNTGTSDSFAVSGSITISGGGAINLAMILDSGVTDLSGTSYTLLSWTGSNNILGEISDAGSSAAILNDISNGSWTFQENAGNTALMLVAVPEPATWALFGCGLAVAGWRRRKTPGAISRRGNAS